MSRRRRVRKRKPTRPPWETSVCRDKGRAWRQQRCEVVTDRMDKDSAAPRVPRDPATDRYRSLVRAVIPEDVYARVIDMSGSCPSEDGSSRSPLPQRFPSSTPSPLCTPSTQGGGVRPEAASLPTSWGGLYQRTTVLENYLPWVDEQRERERESVYVGESESDASEDVEIRHTAHTHRLPYALHVSSLSPTMYGVGQVRGEIQQDTPHAYGMPRALTPPPYLSEYGTDTHRPPSPSSPSVCPVMLFHDHLESVSVQEGSISNSSTPESEEGVAALPREWIQPVSPEGLMEDSLSVSREVVPPAPKRRSPMPHREESVPVGVLISGRAEREGGVEAGPVEAHTAFPPSTQVEPHYSSDGVVEEDDVSFDPDATLSTLEGEGD
ncbi:hypothetical protein KIPB_010947, partial [Kipferlia bialata]|eukprot:g10947.t1